jgi:hypothetical protein
MNIKSSFPNTGKVITFSNIRFVIGLGQTKDGVEINAGFRSIIVPAIRKELAKLFGGYTETTGFGGWYDVDRGVLVEEANVIFDVAIILRPGFNFYDAQIDKAQTIVDLAKALLQQECVLVQFTQGHSAIV